MDKKVVLTFTENEVNEARMILIDKDEQAALKFLKECFDKKIRAQKPQCNPDFVLYKDKDEK